MHSGINNVRSLFRELMYLGNIWQQVVGDTLRVLSNLARAVSSNGVEVAQQHCIPILTKQRHECNNAGCLIVKEFFLNVIHTFAAKQWSLIISSIKYLVLP